jgi:hypothetical protein
MNRAPMNVDRLLTAPVDAPNQDAGFAERYEVA